LTSLNFFLYIRVLSFQRQKLRPTGHTTDIHGLNRHLLAASYVYKCDSLLFRIQWKEGNMLTIPEALNSGVCKTLWSYWLLLQRGIVQIAPYTEAIFWSIVRPPLSSYHSRLIHQSCLVEAETPSSEVERNGEKCPSVLSTKYICHTSQGSLQCRKMLQHGADDLTSPPKEVVLRILWP
jgi:hypothetical protein